MTYLNTADCVRRMKVGLNRPATDGAFTVTTADDVLYDALTEAQDAMTKLIATYIPDCMISDPTAMVTADSGKTYTFGTDVDSARYFPLGNFSVFATRADIPDFPLLPGVDYLVEGTKIRMPNNTTRTFADGGPWAQTINASNVIASGTEPTIPVICRLAMIEKAKSLVAPRVGLDSAAFDQDFNERWLEVLAAVRTQVVTKQGAPLSRRPMRFRSWYR